MKRKAKTYLLLFLLSLLLSTAAVAADPLLNLSSGITANYEVDAGAAWHYDGAYSENSRIAYVAGNSGSNTKSISNIALSVSEPGILTFDYKVSCSGSGSGGANYALYYKLNEAVTFDNKETANNYNIRNQFQGTVDWTTHSVPILPEHIANEKATLYLAYHRGGGMTSGDNKVAIANVNFEAGNKNVTISAVGAGSVTGAESGEMYLGTSLSLMAQAQEGSRFYGFTKDGKFLTTNTTTEITVDGDNEIKAIFGSDGTYAARRNGTFYTESEGGLLAALKGATKDDEIVMLDNSTLTEDMEIPEGVVLYIPFDDTLSDGATALSPYDMESYLNFDAPGSKNGSESDSGNISKQVYKTLTIPENVSLTVNGTLRIGATIGTPNQRYQGHVSGLHGKIYNQGEIRVHGILDALGMIEGPGNVIAQKNARVYEAFMVLDFSGGTNTVALVGSMQVPFKHYAMQNIKSCLTLEQGASLFGHCNLYAGSKYNKTIAPIITNDQALFQSNGNTKIVRTYAENKSVQSFADIGLMTYEVEGGLTFQSLTLEIFGFPVTTAHVEYPMPYNIHFVLKNGEYQVTQGLNLLPGAEMLVEEDAKLTITGEAYTVGVTEGEFNPDTGEVIEGTQQEITQYPRMFVMDGLKQSTMSGKRYPNEAELKESGFAQSAVLTVNGTLHILDYGRFGGIVQTGGAGTIITGRNANLGTPVLSDNNYLQVGGASGGNDSRTYLPWYARIFDGTAIAGLQSGKTYKGSTQSFTLSEYEAKYMQPIHADEYGDYAENLQFFESGYKEAVPKNPNQPSGDKYYRKLNTEKIVLNQAMSGAFIAQEPSYILGDINGDGKITADDVTMLYRHVLAISEITDSTLSHVADVTGDGKINADDVTKIFRYVLGIINTLE